MHAMKTGAFSLRLLFLILLGILSSQATWAQDSFDSRGAKAFDNRRSAYHALYSHQDNEFESEDFLFEYAAGTRSFRVNLNKTDCDKLSQLANYDEFLDYLISHNLTGDVTLVDASTKFRANEIACLRKCSSLVNLSAYSLGAFAQELPSSIESINLSNPDKEDLVSIQNLPKLKDLCLYHFSGEKNSLLQISKIASLSELTLSFSGTSKIEASDFCSLSLNRGLTMLEISHYPATIEFANCLSKISSLNSLVIDEAKNKALRGAICKELSKLPELKNCNYIERPDAAHLQYAKFFPHQRHLTLNKITMTSRDVDALLEMKELENLTLVNVSLPSGAFTKLCLAPRIEDIHAEKCNLNISNDMSEINKPHLTLGFTECNLSLEDLNCILSVQRAGHLFFHKERTSLFDSVRQIPSEAIGFSCSKMTKATMVHILKIRHPRLALMGLSQMKFDSPFLNDDDIGALLYEKDIQVEFN